MNRLASHLSLALALLGVGATWAIIHMLDSRPVIAKSLESIAITPECGYFTVNKGQRFALSCCTEKTFLKLALVPDSSTHGIVTTFTKTIPNGSLVMATEGELSTHFSPWEPPDFESKLLASLFPAARDDYRMVIKRPSKGTRRSYHIYFFPGETKEAWGNLVVTWSAG